MLRVTQWFYERKWRKLGRCRNSCVIDAENPLAADGFCQSCHEYPEG